MKLSKYKILLADDNLINQKFLSRLFQKWEVEHKIVDNGEDALNNILNDGFDLIILDIQMPLLSGLEITQNVREAGIKTPIVALTGHGMEYKSTCLEVGMNDFLTQPVNSEKLYNIILKHLGVEE